MASTLDVSQTGRLLVELGGIGKLELVTTVPDVVPAIEDEEPDVAAEVDPTPVDVWLEDWGTDEPGPALVVPFDAPDVVDRGGVTSAVVVAEIEVVLPEPDELDVEAGDVLAPDDTEVVWDPAELLLPEEDPDDGEVLEAREVDGNE
jgi:hypothetical protein